MHSKQGQHPAPRIDYAGFQELAPAVVAALAALGKAVDQSGLDKSLTELLKVHASRLNACAFCLQYHLNLARQLGVDEARLEQLADWRTAPVYTPRERAALAWTEALTLQAQHAATDAAYLDVQAQFSASEIAFLTAAVAAIQAWNRIAGALHFTPPPAVAVAATATNARA
jgi:AhpD family alkylhydroperoxidase